jgi:hypothetical protein
MPDNTNTDQGKHDAEVKPTGKTETIAGYSCEHTLITGDDGKTYDVCVAHGLGGFMLASAGTVGMARGGRGGGGAADAWVRMLGNDAFPLKVQAVGGKVELEVTGIEKKSLDDALFKLPEGYMNMSGMMGRPPHE